MDKPLIEFQQVTKRFDGRTVLDCIDLQVFEGEVTTLIGKSGVGKSVLLKHIIGLLQPDEGRVLLKGQLMDRIKSHEKDSLLRQMSYMFQNNALFDSMTVYNNIAMPLRYDSRFDKSEIDDRVMERLRQTELEKDKDKFPDELSGGMQKRVALARALITDPKIVLFDEPTTGQDPIRKNAILSMIAEYQREYKFSAVLVSHDLPDVFFISNRIIALYEGRIIFQGLPEEFDDLDHPFRKEFVRSLEALEEELHGLYSKRHFKIRYQMELHQNLLREVFTVAVFRLKEKEQITRQLGHTAYQEFFRAMGTFINKHFDDIGGFSTRFNIDQYVTVLPYSDLEEARQIIDSFKIDFQENGIPALRRVFSPHRHDEQAVQITMLSGLAQGKPHEELESIMALAERNQRKISTFKISCKGV
jgi:phospholipid/cholesterol/gamma-HCH transport system ATP-binding protein